MGENVFTARCLLLCSEEKGSKIYKYQHVRGRRGTSPVRLSDMARDGGQPVLTVSYFAILSTPFFAKSIEQSHNK
jgi:hypothetical protein